MQVYAELTQLFQQNKEAITPEQGIKICKAFFQKARPFSRDGWKDSPASHILGDYATFLDIPKEIYNNFMELAHDAVLKTLEETGAKGYNLVMNNDEVAGQVIHHSHLHIIPRKKDDGLSTFIGGKKH